MLGNFYRMNGWYNEFTVNNLSDLKNKRCVPVPAGSKPLKDEEYKDVLKSELEGWWVIDEKVLEKEFEFKDFKEALAFVNKVGELAESENHHPDINLHGWNKVTVSLSTHSIGGLSENDFIVASKI